MENEKVSTPKPKSYKWLIIITLLAIGIGGYFGLEKYGDKLVEMGMVTKYPRQNSGALIDSTSIAKDTSGSSLANELNLYEPKPDSTDKLLLEGLIDSVLPIWVENEERLDSEYVEVIELKDLQTDTRGLEIPAIEKPVDMLEVDTEATHIAATPEVREDLFDELLPVNTKSTEDINTFRLLYNTDILSSKTLYKLASIAGKSILLNEAYDKREIFETLEMEEEVEGILLCDRKGKIIYATNVKYKNDYVATVLPELEITDNVLNWVAKDGKLITQIPIYSTFGKIGTVLITTAPKM